MALVLADRVRDTTTTTGTGTVTLSGTAPTGYQTFGSAIGNANTTYYTINAGSQWEVGIGTYSSTGPTLARTTILASSSAGAAVDFAVGTKDVFVTYPAEKSVNYDASDNVGIGTSSPGYKLQSVTNGVSAPSEFVASNTAGAERIHLISRNSAGISFVQSQNSQLQVGTYDSYALQFVTANTGRMLIDTSGNVGIGTASPTSGAGYTSVSIRNATNGGNIDLGVGSTIYGQWLATSASSRLLAVNGAYQTFEVGGTERMRIDTSGNVGIGTTSPGVKLDVFGTVRSTGTSVGRATLEPGAASNSGYAGFYNAAGTRVGYVGFANDSSGIFLINSEVATNAMTFSTAATERARITSAGNLGVGSTNPEARLQVRQDLDGTTGIVIQNRNGSGTPIAALRLITGGLDLADNRYGAIESGGVAAADLRFITSSGGPVERMRITATGNVGIGTSAPTYKFEVTGRTLIGNGVAQASPSTTDIGSTSHAIISGQGGNALFFGQYGGAEGFAQWIQSSFTNPTTAAYNLILQPIGGNVGIATNAPGFKLDVSGDAHASGSIFTGSDANGWGRFINSGGALYVQAGSLNSGSATAQPIIFTNMYGGSERMRLNASGTLQINTTSTPTYGSPKLVVDGPISGKGFVTINSSTATTIAEGAGFLIVVRNRTHGGTAVVQYENATTPIIIATSGGTTFQTGTPSGSAQIQLTNRSGNLGIAALASGDRNNAELSVTIIQAYT